MRLLACLIVAPQQGYDEPAILSYAISPFCPTGADGAQHNNKVVAETRTAIAHSGIGVEVRAGAAKPDISSVEAFKSALLNAKSIGYLKQDGTSGAYLHGLFERLGILDAIKSKVLRLGTDTVSELVAKGE